MTVFLCILAAASLTTSVRGDGARVVLVYALSVVETLGLATLALVSYLS